MMNEENKEGFDPQENREATGPDTQETDATRQAGTQPRGPYAYGVPPNIPPMPPVPEKTRRVGTITMGLALIAAGVLTLLALLFPGFDIVFMLRLSPLVLVLLGLEIILNFIFFKGQKLKYDFLSGFVCFLLIMGCMFAAAVPTLIRYSGWGPYHNEMAKRIQQSADQFLVEQLADMTVIQSARTDIYLQRADLEYNANAAYTDLQPSDHVGLSIVLTGTYTDKASFAAACRPVLDRLQALPLKFDDVTLHYYDSSEQLDRYELTVDNPFEWKQDAAGLAALVDNSDSEWRRLESEREQMYSNLESEREQLSSQMESERSDLSSEREELYSQMESEREELSSQMESEREELNKEREELSRSTT